MERILLDEKDEIEAFLRKNVFLHIYALGDLDDLFWEHTRWFGLKGPAGLKAVTMTYHGYDRPVLVAMHEGDMAHMRELLTAIAPILPDRCYAHLSPGSLTALEESYLATPCGIYHKMALVDHSALDGIDTSRVVPLTTDDLDDMLEFYETSYPNHWFQPRMLRTGQYYGIREKGVLVSVAGVHVYSKRYEVAAMGNITTRPEHRGKGMARAVSAKLCKALLKTVKHIGLNVSVNNKRALKLYRGMGFEIIGSYEEYALERKGER